MARRTFQYWLYPAQAQEQALQVQLDVSRCVYNMALEERKQGRLGTGRTQSGQKGWL
jgi:hypothetical protein